MKWNYFFSLTVKYCYCATAKCTSVEGLSIISSTAEGNMNSSTACIFYRLLHGHHGGELVPWTAPVSNSPVEGELQQLSFRTMDSASDSPADSMMWNWYHGQCQVLMLSPLWPTQLSYGTTESASPWTSVPQTVLFSALHSGCSHQCWSWLCWQRGSGGLCAFISTHTAMHTKTKHYPVVFKDTNNYELPNIWSRNVALPV